MPNKNKRKPIYSYGSDVNNLRKRVLQLQGTFGIGPGSYDRWVQDGPEIHYNTITNDEGILIPDNKSGYIGVFTKVPGYKSKAKEQLEDLLAIVKGYEPLIRIFPQKTDIVRKGDENYNLYAQELVNEMRKAGQNAFVGYSSEIPYNLPTVIVSRKSGGTMKRLVPKHLYGNQLIPKNKRIIVESEVNLTGIPRVNPLYDLQYISPAISKTGEAGYLRITPEGFGAYTEEFVPKSDVEYYNTVHDLYNRGKLLGSPESTLPRLNEYTKSPAQLNSTSSKLLQKFRTEERYKDDINGYKKYKFKASSINNI